MKDMRSRYPYENFTSKAWPLEPGFLTTTTVDAILSCPLGIPLNVLVLFLSFKSKRITGEFKYFLGNLAIWDLAYCFCMLNALVIASVHETFGLQMTVFMCSLIGYPAYAVGIGMVLCLPLISVNRYVLLVEQRENYFTKKKIVLMCCYPCIVLVWPLADFLFAPFVTPYPRCGFTYHIPLLVEFFAIPATLGYCAAVFCNYRIYKILSEHSERAKQVLKSNRAVLRERMLLKAMILQAVVPILCSLPMTVYLYKVAVNGWGDAFRTAVLNVGAFSPTLDDLAHGAFMFNPTFDALITLSVVKVYRDAVKYYVGKQETGDYIVSRGSRARSVHRLAWIHQRRTLDS